MAPGQRVLFRCVPRSAASANAETREPVTSIRCFTTDLQGAVRRRLGCESVQRIDLALERAHFTAEPLYDPGEQHGVCGDDNANYGELHRRAVEERAPDVDGTEHDDVQRGPDRKPPRASRR